MNRHVRARVWAVLDRLDPFTPALAAIALGAAAGIGLAVLLAGG